MDDSITAARVRLMSELLSCQTILSELTDELRRTDELFRSSMDQEAPIESLLSVISQGDSVIRKLQSALTWTWLQVPRLK